MTAMKKAKWAEDPDRPEVLVRKFGRECEARIMYSEDAHAYEIELFPAGDAYTQGTLSEAKLLAEVYFAGYRGAREYSSIPRRSNLAKG